MTSLVRLVCPSSFNNMAAVWKLFFFFFYVYITISVFLINVLHFGPETYKCLDGEEE